MASSVSCLLIHRCTIYFVHRGFLLDVSFNKLGKAKKFLLDLMNLIINWTKGFEKFAFLRNLRIFSFNFGSIGQFSSVDRQKLFFCRGVYFLRSFHAYGIFIEQCKDNNKMIIPTKRREQSLYHIKTLGVHIKIHIFSEKATEIWQKIPADLAFFLIMDISSAHFCGLLRMCIRTLYVTSMIIYAPHGI